MFCYFEDTFHWSPPVPKRFKRNINEELYQTIRASSDIEVGKGRIFKKHINAGVTVNNDSPKIMTHYSKFHGK